MSENTRRIEQRTWGFAGPVARRYEFDRGLGAFIVGPTAGGKTIASARRCLRAALWQQPSPRDGWRRARIFVVCPTYRIAWDSVIPSYLKVMDRPWGKWNGAKGDPADHLIQIGDKGPDGQGPVEVDVRFRAVQDLDLDEFFRGKECTGFWLPEVDTHKSSDIISYALNRVGRFPEPEDRLAPPAPPGWSGVFGDANTPLIGSWFDEQYYQGAPEGFKIHKQAPGYDPDTADGFHARAENVANLKKIHPEYYRDRARLMDVHDVERLFQCKRKYGRFGQPVHPYFDEAAHVAPGPMEPDAELPVVIGVDVGFRGAAAFLQRSLFGHWRQYAEIVAYDTENGEMDAVELGQAIKAKLQTRFPRCRRAIIVMDPAGKSRSSLNKGMSWIGELQRSSGIRVIPAPTNDPKLRRHALKAALQRRNGFLIDPECRFSITALNGGFHYPKRGDSTSMVAKKNEYSDCGESIEYACLGGDGINDRAGVLPSMGLDAPGASNVVEVVFD
ncbi:hypothetical protein NI454_01000 [Brevundimonas diminuta]|uniref:hypothetical protein n=1 Tax=Brevundimonas diminuta TaxID=293 RepID=UPI002096D9F1|nr:hypothetical protein [Brevundimonas diminuta]MCO8028521.1 hypothetical protein [Brevundimonas diminuta]